MECAFGIEEEFFVVDKTTHAIERHAHEGFVSRAMQYTDGAVSPELLQSQIEVQTPICYDQQEARHHLNRLRQALARAADEFGLAVIASGTHATADWVEQLQTPKRRYDRVTEELQILAPRNLICGMHVHVSLPDDDLRIDVMRRSLPFLPLFLALSCSSPFWRGMKTGFASYRMTSNDEMPRSGTPPLFEDWYEYKSYIDAMCGARIIKDPTYIWWTIRPSHNYPTLELRAPDICTSVDDALAIAALYRCLVRALVEDETVNIGISAADRALAEENQWRVQRFGLEAALVDPFGAPIAVPVTEVVRRLVDDLAPHAAALGCTADIAHVEHILANGSSAERQVAIYDAAMDEGLTNDAALARVNSWLERETRASYHAIANGQARVGGSRAN